MARESIRNPQLAGGSFTWVEGSIGVLLFHGFTATTSEVRLLAGRLREAGYTVAGPLLPGHGASPDELNKCRWQDWVQAAEVAYKELSDRCELVFVGGESMGGLLALYLASCLPEAAGVMLYAPALKLRSRLTRWLAPWVGPLVPAFAKAEGDPTPADEHWQGYMVYPGHATAQFIRLQVQVRRRLPGIRQPLLIVQGRLDQTVHPAVPEIIATTAGSEWKEVHWLEQSGHCVILDREWKKRPS